MKPLPLMTDAELDEFMAQADADALADRESGIPVEQSVLRRGEDALAEIARRHARNAA